MRKTATGTIILSIVICFVSCSKDNNSTATSSLSGSWNFKGIHANTWNSAQDVEAGIIFKDVTTSDYTTTGNAGSVSISGNIMTGTGIAYSADMLMLVTEYQDGIVTDTFSTSLPFSIPPTNSSSTFEIIGTDSIHFIGSSLIGSGGSGTPAATGAKFSIAADMLTLTTNVVQDKIIDTLGTTITQHETATVVTTLQKQ
jgi:hypothetical protein